MNDFSDFWNTLAPFHAEVEDCYFDLASVRRLGNEIQSPVLVVGAGHGLIVAELRKQGHQCDGVDLSGEMVRKARLRRGITLVQADAKAMPFPSASYQTAIYTTGVIDFIANEEAIKATLTEGRRVVKESGRLFVAFYKSSNAQANFMELVGLLSNGTVALRESFELYLLNPAQMIGWIARRAGVGRFRATLALLRLSLFCSMQERRMTLKMQRILRKIGDARSLINAAPQTQPHRNQAQIESLFGRLGIPIQHFSTFKSCYIVRI